MDLKIFKKAFQNLTHFPLPIRFLAVFAVILIPILVVMALFYPFIVKKQGRGRSVSYHMPADFTRNDLQNIVAQMRHDPQCNLYFRWLPEKIIENAAGAVYADLDQHQGQARHYELLRATKIKVESFAILFNNLEYSEAFFKMPLKYPDLINALRGFLEEEFKLMIAGLCYKTLYDANFKFEWDSSAHASSAKFRKVLSRFDQSRAEFEKVRNHIFLKEPL